MQVYKVILFYKFIKLDDPQLVAQTHKNKCAELNLRGRMLVASEGINSTFEGLQKDIEEYVKFLRSDERFSDIVIKESVGNGKAFPKLKIKVRDEIVSLKAGNFDVPNETAPQLTANELKKWYENNEDFVVLDLRNDYEIACGKFDKTVNPGLVNFRDLPKNLDKIVDLKNKKIVSVCTGGIRCEKATCLLKREGFTDVYQLKDGIHTYMKEYPGDNFKGTLFVFDNRITTDVVTNDKKIVVGKCVYCEIPTEKYYSDDRIRPSKKVLCCPSCYEENKDCLRDIVVE